MKKFFLVILSSLVINSFLLAQDVLVSVDKQGYSKITKLQSLSTNVIYDFGERVLLSVTAEYLKLIERNGIEFKVIDSHSSQDNYFLIYDKSENILSKENLDVIFSLGRYSLIKNLESSSPLYLDKSMKISKLKPNLNKYSNLITPNTQNSEMDSLITSVIDDISVDSIRGYIQHLEDYGTRFMAAPNRHDVSDWIYKKFENFGYTNVEYDSIYTSTYINYQYVSFDTTLLQRNIVATIEGTGAAEEIFIVCGHYDSFNSDGDPFIYAPGASDNASGSAAVLEIARVLIQNNFRPERTIKFIAFAAEELMNFGDGGSELYAQEAFNSGMDIKLVMNHDMITHTFQSLENSVVDVNRHFTSSHFAKLAIESIEKFTVIKAKEVDGWSSDLRPFNELGYDGIYFEESEFSPYYHSSNDRIENYSMEFCAEIIKASCATIMTAVDIPDPVENIQIKAQGDGTSVVLSWDHTNTYDFDHYNIYVGTEPGVYDRNFSTTNNSIIISDLQNGVYNFIGISVADVKGYDGYIIEKEYLPFSFTFDKGILIVDETSDGNGTIMKPSDEQVDEFYSSLLEDFNTQEFDIISEEGISLTDFGNYSTIIWHGNDSKNLQTLSKVKTDLVRYLDAGGNFLYTGYLPSKAFESNLIYPNEFAEGDFIHDYLKIKKVNKDFGARFIGAISNLSVYNYLAIDSTKTDESYGYHIPLIESIDASDDAYNIYFFDTHYDTSSVQGSMYMEPVGVEYLGEDFKTVTLSFPLYYMKEESAKNFLHTLLANKFSETVSVKTETASIPKDFNLYQNYPNPFNPNTIIGYSISREVNVTLKIYDILGREVVTLVDKRHQPGQYKVKWDAGEQTSGMYFYKLEAGAFNTTKKMILLK